LTGSPQFIKSDKHSIGDRPEKESSQQGHEKGRVVGREDGQVGAMEPEAGQALRA